MSRPRSTTVGAVLLALVLGYIVGSAMLAARMGTTCYGIDSSYCL